MKTFLHLLLVSMAAAGVTSCRKSIDEPIAAMDPAVIAMVDGRPITRHRIELELARSGPGTTREQALAELIQFEATLAKARLAGFENESGTMEAIERLLVSRFTEREMAAAESPTITEQEVRDRYTAEAARYSVPAAARGGVLFLKANSKAEPSQHAALRKKAEQLHAEVLTADSPTFARLVREHSQDQATRYQQGDTGWLSATPGANSAWESAVLGALMELRQPGDCAPLLETPRGFYLIRLADTRPAATRPLAEVGEAIRHQLQREKRQQLSAAFQARMLDGLDVRTNHTAFHEVLTLAGDHVRPPAVP